MYRHVCTSWLTFSSSPDDVLYGRTATVYCRVQGRSRPTMRVGELSYKDGPGRQCVSVPSFQLIELFATCYLPTRAFNGVDDRKMFIYVSWRFGRDQNLLDHQQKPENNCLITGKTLLLSGPNQGTWWLHALVTEFLIKRIVNIRTRLYHLSSIWINRLFRYYK